MPVKYTRELLAEAARCATDRDEAVRHCGSTPTAGSRRYLRRRMAELDTDTSHFRAPRVRHTEERLRAAVAESASITDVVRRLGISPVGGNQAHIGRRISSLDLDTSHFAAAQRSRPRHSHGDVLVLRTPEDGRTPGRRLWRELLRMGRAETCAMCGNGPAWNGKPLRLEVDHRNGNWWDNRPENLRLLCPNCHAVTDTYRGRVRHRRRPAGKKTRTRDRSHQRRSARQSPRESAPPLPVVSQPDENVLEPNSAHSRLSMPSTVGTRGSVPQLAKRAPV